MFLKWEGKWDGGGSVCPSSIQFSFKIKNWCQFFIFVIFYHKKYENAKSKIWLFFLKLISTSILSTMKGKIQLSGNFAFPTMLQSAAWLSFSVFSGSKNWKLKISVNFLFLFFRQKHFKSLTELPKKEREGSIRTLIFLPLAPSPQIPFPPCEFFFFAPDILSPPPFHATLLWRGGSRKFVFTA